MYKLGFTGTRRPLPFDQRQGVIWVFRSFGGEVQLHHGGCIGGDEVAHEAAKLLGWRIVVHPGRGDAHLKHDFAGAALVMPERPFLDRNGDIVQNAQALIAAPQGPEELRSGTWSTVRKARKRRLPITLVWPCGSITQEWDLV